MSLYSSLEGVSYELYVYEFLYTWQRRKAGREVVIWHCLYPTSSNIDTMIRGQ